MACRLPKRVTKNKPMLPVFIRLPIRFLAALLLTLALMPIQTLCLVFDMPQKKTIPIFFWQCLLKILNIELRLYGTKPAPPVLILANHISWLDIPIIGSVLPVVFIAKSEIARWPFFGLIAKLGRTIFIKRELRFDTPKQRDMVQERLAEGDCPVLFPEGTTGNGTIVRPFKSALLSVAETKQALAGVKVQPLSLVFSKFCGISMGRRQRLNYALTGDVSLWRHMMKFFIGDPIMVDLVFHPPIEFSQIGDRKILASHAHRLIQSGLAAFTAGHRDETLIAEKQ